MHKHKGSRSKIIATIGPACNTKETLKKLILEGIDVCRLNFSHGKQSDHEEVIKIIRELNDELKTNVAILADLQGPKLRIGDVENNGVQLRNGENLVLTSKKCLGNSKCVYMSYQPLSSDVTIGEVILIDDGKIKLEVIDTNQKNEVTTRVISGGILSSKKGVNLPNTKISLPCLTEKDLSDVNFVLDFNIDWIALSFVRSASDILELKDIIKKNKKHTRIVAKIEKPEALNDIENIIDLTDAIMIARGDLGVETPFDKVPIVQKQIVSKCISKAKPVIIATQMMESMITNFRPTRAEATDVSNAVVEGADALMLSGETSVGKYPVEVIRSMQQVIFSTENSGFPRKYDNKPDPDLPSYLPDTICYNACKMADSTRAKGIIVFTYGGASAYKLTSHRPDAKIYAFTPFQHVMTQLSLLRGVHAFYLKPESSINDAIAHSTEILKQEGYVTPGDVLVYVGGIPMKVKGPINNMKIAIVQ